MLLSAAEGRLEAGGGEEAGLLREGERWRRRSCAALVWVRGWHGAAAGAHPHGRASGHIGVWSGRGMRESMAFLTP